MKILVGMPAKDSWGGPAACEPPFVEALSAMNADVVKETYVYGDKKENTGFFERVVRVLKTAFRIRRSAKAEHFDIVHLNTALDLKTMLRDSVTIFLLPRRNVSKIFLKIHGTELRSLETRSLPYVVLRNYLKRKVSGWGLFTTEEKSAFAACGFDESKLFLIKNVVTIGEDQAPDFSRTQKEKGDSFGLLFVSRFIPTKGLVETIRACARLAGRGEKFKLTCIGDGPVREEAEREAARLNISDRVKFTGYITEDEVAGYFLSEDIFVFPTRHWEGFPIVLFKAVALGMPIVTTKIRAAADYLKMPDNCFFSGADPESIAAQIEALLNDTAARSRMSENNIAFGKTLDAQTVAREYLEIYRAICRR
jgi:glycosyltransferase involved in cell wall biosynthesis